MTPIFPTSGSCSTYHRTHAASPLYGLAEHLQPCEPHGAWRSCALEASKQGRLPDRWKPILLRVGIEHTYIRTVQCSVGKRGSMVSRLRLSLHGRGREYHITPTPNLHPPQRLASLFPRTPHLAEGNAAAAPRCRCSAPPPADADARPATHGD